MTSTVTASPAPGTRTDQLPWLFGAVPAWCGRRSRIAGDLAVDGWWLPLLARPLAWVGPVAMLVAGAAGWSAGDQPALVGAPVWVLAVVLTLGVVSTQVGVWVWVGSTIGQAVAIASGHGVWTWAVLAGWVAIAALTVGVPFVTRLLTADLVGRLRGAWLVDALVAAVVFGTVAALLAVVWLRVAGFVVITSASGLPLETDAGWAAAVMFGAPPPEGAAALMVAALGGSLLRAGTGALAAHRDVVGYVAALAQLDEARPRSGSPSRLRRAALASVGAAAVMVAFSGVLAGHPLLLAAAMVAAFVSRAGTLGLVAGPPEALRALLSQVPLVVRFMAVWFTSTTVAAVWFGLARTPRAIPVAATAVVLSVAVVAWLLLPARADLAPAFGAVSRRASPLVWRLCGIGLVAGVVVTMLLAGAGIACAEQVPIDGLVLAQGFGPTGWTTGCDTPIPLLRLAQLTAEVAVVSVALVPVPEMGPPVPPTVRPPEPDIVAETGKGDGPTWAQRGGSIGLDFVPVVGTAKSVQEAVSGEDWVTGEDLNWFERIVGLPPGGKLATGMVMGVVGGIPRLLRRGELGSHSTRLGRGSPSPVSEPGLQGPARAPNPDSSYDSVRNARRLDDAGESMSEHAASYQEHVTGRPWRHGYDVNGVKFDAIDGDVLVDAKAHYSRFIGSDGELIGFMRDDFLATAGRQLDAAGGAPIRWEFLEQGPADLVSKLFEKREMPIEVVVRSVS